MNKYDKNIYGGKKIMNIIEGSFITGDARIAIVASRFNEFITSKLIAGLKK